MGAFFTNVQVHVGGATPAEVRGKTEAAIRQCVLAGPFVEVTSGDEPPDRTVILGPQDPGAWAAVYDELTETQDLETLTELAKVLSKTTGGAAVGVLVHDSDVLELRLCRAGMTTDAFSSDPDYFEKVGRKRRRELSGQPDRWADLLVPGATAEDLRGAWHGQDLSAEDVLTRTAALLGIAPERCLVGFNGVSTEPLPDTFVRLCFRSTEARLKLVEAEGAPRLVMFSGGGRIRCSVGDPITNLSAMVRSNAGASTGLEIMLHGDAIDQALIEPARVTVRVGATAVEAAPMRGERDQQAALIARLTDFEMPAGLTVGGHETLDGYLAALFQEAKPSTPADMAALLRRLEAPEQAKWASTMTLHVDAVASHPGIGNLLIAVAPLANPGGGVVLPPYRIRVWPPFRRPLRCTERSEYISTCLAAMATPRTLLARIALGADRATCGEVAADAIEHWNAVVAPDGVGRYETVLTLTRAAKVKRGRLQAKDIPGGRRWKALRESLRAGEYLAGHLGSKVADATTMETNPGSGFALDMSSIYFQDTPDEIVPYLGLWYDVSGRTPQEVGAAKGALTAIVDEVCGRTDGLQAFVAMWESDASYAQHTLYKSACGVSGQCTTGRTWSTRFLRAVTERLWLGQDLLRRLGTTEHLQPIAEVRPVGKGVRVVLRDPGDLDTLELALERLLPDQGDWQEATKLLSPRRSDQD